MHFAYTLLAIVQFRDIRINARSEKNRKRMTKDKLKTGLKSRKPLVERQRRARINKHLEEIKSLILSSLYHDDPALYREKSCVRMDKAEILEFAVNFIKNQRNMRNDQKSLKHFPAHQVMTPAFPLQLPVPSSPLASPTMAIFTQAPIVSLPSNAGLRIQNSPYNRNSTIENSRIPLSVVTREDGHPWRPWN